MAGGLTITHDIKRDMKDEKGNLVMEGNGYKPLTLGYGSHCDYNPNSPWFKKIVRRGTPDPKERHWVNGINPVWRIPTDLFVKNELDDEGNEVEVVDHEAWKRLLDFYELNLKQKDKLIFYEPDIEDIEIKKFGRTAGFHFPLWVLNELVVMKEFEKAKRESLVGEPSEKKIDDQTYTYLLQAIADREKEEAGEEKHIDEENMISERKKKAGDQSRAEGRRRQVKEKVEAQKDAESEARKEAMAKKAKEMLEKDGILS